MDPLNTTEGALGLFCEVIKMKKVLLESDCIRNQVVRIKNLHDLITDENLWIL
jgi:hypothetical protein